ADLAVHHAAEHPDSVAGLVLIDGANPVPEPFLTAADLPELRALWADMAGTARQMDLTGQDMLDVNLEVEAVRAAILDRYRRIERPISMIMSTAMAGDSAEGRTPWRNRNWRAGVERLVREHPVVSATWLDADHGLVVTHAPDIAGIIRRRLARC
ncbi:MAG: hypothetical protein ACRDQ0_18405, partial [Pseudonocardia sp.]